MAGQDEGELTVIPNEPSQILALEDHHGSGAYPKRPAAIVRGRGVNVWDAKGKEYLDMTAGQGVALLGHSHPAVVKAVQRQAERLITCPEIFYNDRRVDLYARLSRHTPPGFDRFFLCNSGAEAVEGALKFARLQTGRSGFVAAKNGFHGRTLGALSATWKPSYRQPFEPLLPGIEHVPFNDLAAAAEAIGDATAAVLLEVVQGEGGVVPADSDYLEGLRQLCDDRGALLVFDEVQTGLGRTGRWWAAEHYGVQPDLFCLGKGLAGGLPMGAVVWHRDLGNWPKGSHGSTFGGNPLACSAAAATLETLDNGLIPQAAAVGEAFIAQLQSIDHPLIRQVRGLGMMIALDLRRRVTPALKALMDQGVLALPAGPTVLRLLPPLIVTEGELDRVMTAIVATLEAISHDGS